LTALSAALGKPVRVVNIDNEAGMKGGIALWRS
jgi:hypothetical protein